MYAKLKARSTTFNSGHPDAYKAPKYDLQKFIRPRENTGITGPKKKITDYKGKDKDTAIHVTLSAPFMPGLMWTKQCIP